MKLQIDKQYAKIAIYTIATIVLTYVLISFFNIIIMSITNIKELTGNIMSFLGTTVSVFKLLIISVIISYILDPLVNKYQEFYDKYSEKFMNHEEKSKRIVKKIVLEEKQRSEGSTGKNGYVYKPRTAGASLTYITIFIILFFISSNLINSFSNSDKSEPDDNIMINEELKIIEDEIHTENSFLEGLSQGIYKAVEKFNYEYVKIQIQLEKYGLLNAFTKITQGLVVFTKNMSVQIVELILGLGTGVMSTLIIAALTFYLMRDKEKFVYNLKVFMNLFFTDKGNTVIKNFADDMHTIFSGYLRGQMIDAVIMGSLLGFSLSLAGIPFAWTIGFFSGFSNLIPYVGAFVGFLLAVLSGLLSGTPILAVYATIIVLIVQQIDSLFIVPKFVGESVELSPFLVILSLTVAGSLFGILGMVFAVPITAMIKILIVRFVRRNIENPGWKKLLEKWKKIEL